MDETKPASMTPLPWSLYKPEDEISPQRLMSSKLLIGRKEMTAEVATINRHGDTGNGLFVVRACNSYQVMLAALTAAPGVDLCDSPAFNTSYVQWWERRRRALEMAQVFNGKVFNLPNSPRMQQLDVQNINAPVVQLVCPRCEWCSIGGGRLGDIPGAFYCLVCQHTFSA